MSEAMIVRHCSPTLAGLKTANMFTCPFESGEGLLNDLRSINIRLGRKGVRAIPLRIKDGRALIYFYRPKKLENDLKSPVSEEILGSSGYESGTVSARLAELIKRLRRCEDFPHEIGLFLGYPPEDVRCFMCERSRECRCVGCWKAYSNEAEAEKTFARYKKCTEVYVSRLEKGSSLERLTVAG